MGRSTKFQAGENRARIVEIASGLFRAQGIDVTGIADIMKAAGMTQGGFYKHFESKEALAAEACDHAFQQSARTWSQVASEASSKMLDPMEAIVSYYGADKPLSLTCPLIAFSREVARRHQGDPLKQAYVEGVSRFLAVLETASPGLSRHDARRILHQMVGSKMLDLAAS